MRLISWLKGVGDYSLDFWSFIKGGLYTLFAFLNIDMDIVNIIMWLMIIDIATGASKCFFIKNIKFSFKQLYIGLLSKLVIILIPMVLALVALGLGYNFIWVVDLVLKLVVVSEAISIFTNFISMKEKKEIENKDYLHIILVLIRNYFIKLFDSFANTLKNNSNSK